MGYTLLGYSHPAYAQSLAEFGRPRELRQSGGAFLERSIAGTSYSDAMGAYPLFACERWNYLAADLDSLGNRLVSFYAVLDPFCELDETALRDCFPDLVLPFKTHFVIDFRQPLQVAEHHQRNIRKAGGIEVQVTNNPSVWLGEWVRLYDNLIHRHQIGDIRRFSACAFSRQLQIPGMVAFRALHGGKTIGMLLFLIQNETVYYHLGAYSSEGYELKASFALFAAAIEHFKSQDMRYLNLGSGAGMVDSPEDGLTRFKRGWANTERTAYFCGRILNREVYASITAARNIPETTYFPAYRKGEFCKKQQETTA
ncbi:MAG: GNAT family N-acetyltransferase [Limisphaerales bacterium]